MTKKRSSVAAEKKDDPEEILQFAPVGGPKKVPGAFGKEAELEKLRPLDRTGVIYIGHIPHGFYEEPMEKYFSQFGEVKNIVLCRSKKTGKSKGYAFVQFANDKVARIAAEATNGYALLEKVLKSHIVPAEKVSEDLFQFAGKKWNAVPWRKVIRDAQAEPKTEKEAQKRLARLTKREAAQAAKRRKLGIDFELDDSYELQAKKRYGFTEEDNDEEEEEEDEKEDKETNMKRTKVEVEKVVGGKSGKSSEDIKVEKLDSASLGGVKRKRDDVSVPSSVIPAKKSVVAPSAVPINKTTIAPSEVAKKPAPPFTAPIKKADAAAAPIKKADAAAAPIKKADAAAAPIKKTDVAAAPIKKAAAPSASVSAIPATKSAPKSTSSLLRY
jgi:nucleolar protein 15